MRKRERGREREETGWGLGFRVGGGAVQHGGGQQHGEQGILHFSKRFF